MQEQLRQILEAEAEARRRLDAARQECKRLLWQAEEDGRQRVREAQKMRDAIVRDVEDQLVAEARAEAQRVSERMHAKGLAMRALAAPHMDRAVEAVVHALLARDTGDGW